MSKDIANLYIRPVVEWEHPNTPLGVKTVSVLVTHSELDTLVGRLMQMCDLIGDIEQRKALKDTIKQISRDWLDDLYDQSGYDKYTGLKEMARVISDIRQ